MKQEGLKFFTDIHLTIIAFLIFFSYFIFITVKALRASQKHIQHLEKIPFSSEGEHGK